MDKDLDKIRKLLALADAEEGRPEGANAARLAQKRMKKLGLTRADIDVGERLILDDKRDLWEDALLNLVAMVTESDLIEREEGSKTLLILLGSHTKLENTSDLFSVVRSKIDRDASLYKRFQLRNKASITHAAMFVYYGAAVLGVATAWKNLQSPDRATQKNASESESKSEHEPVKKKERKTGDPKKGSDRPIGPGYETRNSLDILGEQLEIAGNLKCFSAEVNPVKEGYESGLAIGQTHTPEDFLGLRKIEQR